MVGRGHGEAGFAKLGIAILGFAALAVMLSGVSGVPGSVATPNPSDQLAQVPYVPPPEIPTTETAAEQTVSTTNVSCQTALPDNVPADHYLRRQLIQNVGGAEALCGVNSDGSVVIAGSVSATCPAYPGPSGEGATPQCPTAIVYRDPGQDDYLICWNIGTSSRCPAQTSQTNEGAGDTASNETAGDRLDAVADSIADDTPDTAADNWEVSASGRGLENVATGEYRDFKDYYGMVETVTANGVSGWTTPDGEFISNSQMREEFGSSFQLTGGDGGGAFGVGGTNDWSGDQISGEGFADTPPTSVTPTTPSDGTGDTPRPAPAPATPPPGATPTAPSTPAPVGNPNPATPAPSGDGRFPGTRLDNPGSYENQRFTDNFNGGAPYSQPRYRSLETPQERALRERLRSHFGGSREPSIVDRFARLIGADAGPVVRMSPEGQRMQGGQPQPTQPAQQRFIIRASDAHYRSIEQIANDVATNNIPAGSRVDHYARALRVLGGPDTNRREVSINPALASLQDLIVEDEAIRAMFVAEQTAEREKNRVFCVDGEESVSCQARRTAVAERIERETFVAELQKRELPDNAVQHFLAVYDGWVRPDVPAPASNPLLLADAPASASLTPDAGARATATTTNEGFVSWAWGGVRNGAERMFEALRQWLTP